MKSWTNVIACAALIGATSLGQGPVGVTPFAQSGDLIVADTGAGRVLRLSDLNLDGDFNDAGEITVYFQGQAGLLALQFPTGLTVDARNVVFVSDSTSDAIFRLEDLDGNGDCMGVGEATTWYTPAVAVGGVPSPTMFGLVVAQDGTIYVANSNTTSTTSGLDTILKFHDDNQDGDALDSGESVIYASFTNTSVGASIPTNVGILPDGSVLYTENGAATAVGALQKGVWRLHDDVVPNGVCTDPGEVTLWYVPTSASSSFFYGLAMDRDGTAYVTDTGLERVLKARDLDANASITLVAEESVFYSVGAASTMWACAVGNGAVAVVEDTAPDRVYVLRDLNADGDASDAGEKVDVWQDTLGAFDIGAPRAIAFLKGPSVKFDAVPLQLGQSATLTVDTVPNASVGVFVGAIPVSIVLPPYGTLGFDLLPGAYFELIPVSPVGPTGGYSLTLPVPGDPAFLNVSLVLQGVSVEPSRTRLATAQIVTFQ